MVDTMAPLLHPERRIGVRTPAGAEPTRERGCGYRKGGGGGGAEVLSVGGEGAQV